MFPSMDNNNPLTTLSRADFLLFHKMDRELYTILVTNLSRDPSESMQLLTLWLWLEKDGFENVVQKILSLPFILINEIADESLICLTYLTNNNNNLFAISSSEGNDIPLLQSLTDNKFSLKYFLENRNKAIRGMEKTKEVCDNALGDIMQEVSMRNMAERMVEHTNFWFGSIGPANLQFGSVGIAGAMVQPQSNNNRGGGGGGIIRADDRTLFVTFSKGYRVEEWEVKEFFTMAYGDCIEALFMQETQPNEQALFARIVFHKVSTIAMILGGASKVKFSINGKHVWARKFVPKRANTGRVMLSGETSGFGSGVTK